MKNLVSYFDVPFDDKSITLSTLIAFATDHYQRLIALNTGGRYDERISALQAVLAQFKQSDSENMIHLGKRKASKQSKGRLRRSIVQGIARLAAHVIVAYGSKGPEYKLCFPNGRRLFSVCRDDVLKIHLSALHQSLIKLQDGLDPEVITRAAALVSDWQAVHAASETATARKAHAEVNLRTARKALQLELFHSLLEIIRLHPRQPGVLTRYMQPHLLRSRRKRKQETEPTD